MELGLLGLAFWGLPYLFFFLFHVLCCWCSLSGCYGDTELALPDRGNVFYAVTTSVPEIKFVVRRKQQQQLGTANGRLRHVTSTSPWKRLSSFTWTPSCHVTPQHFQIAVDINGVTGVHRTRTGLINWTASYRCACTQYTYTDVTPAILSRDKVARQNRAINCRCDIGLNTSILTWDPYGYPSGRRQSWSSCHWVRQPELMTRFSTAN